MSRKRKKKKSFKDQLINNFKGKTNWFWAVVFVSIIIDFLNSLFYNKTQSFFQDILNGNDVNSVMWIYGISILYSIAIVYTGLMSSYSSERYNKDKINYFSIITATAFGIILITPLIYILNISENVSNFTENEQSTYLMISIGFSFLIIILPLISFKSRYFLGTTKYFIVFIPVMIAVSILINFSTAIWQFLFLDTDNLADPNRSSRFIEFIAIFPFYIMFFSAPRFLLVRKSYNIMTLLSALAMSAYFVWKSLEFVEI